MCGKCGTFSVFCVFSWLSPKLDASFIQAGGRQRAPAAVSNFQIAGAAGKGLPAAAAAPFSAVIYLVFLNIRTAFSNYTTVYPKTQRSQSQLIKSSQKPLFRQPFRPVGPSAQPDLALPGRAPLLPPGMSRALHGPFFRPLQGPCLPSRCILTLLIKPLLPSVPAGTTSRGIQGYTASPARKAGRCGSG